MTEHDLETIHLILGQISDSHGGEYEETVFWDVASP
jgi:hypothetical protein